MGWDRDVTGVEILLALYQETGRADLLELAEDLYAALTGSGPGTMPLPPAVLLSDKKQTEDGCQPLTKKPSWLPCSTAPQVKPNICARW